jgi:hypothetical protein
MEPCTRSAIPGEWTLGDLHYCSQNCYLLYLRKIIRCRREDCQKEYRCGDLQASRLKGSRLSDEAGKPWPFEFCSDRCVRGAPAGAKAKHHSVGWQKQPNECAAPQCSDRLAGDYVMDSARYCSRQCLERVASKAALPVCSRAYCSGEALVTYAMGEQKFCSSLCMLNELKGARKAMNPAGATDGVCSRAFCDNQALLVHRSRGLSFCAALCSKNHWKRQDREGVQLPTEAVHLQGSR